MKYDLIIIYIKYKYSYTGKELQIMIPLKCSSMKSNITYYHFSSINWQTCISTTSSSTSSSSSGWGFTAGRESLTTEGALPSSPNYLGLFINCYSTI